VSGIMLFRARAHTHNRTIDVASFPVIRSIQPTKRDNETADVTLVSDNREAEKQRRHILEGSYRSCSVKNCNAYLSFELTATVPPLVRIQCVLIYVF